MEPLYTISGRIPPIGGRENFYKITHVVSIGHLLNTGFGNLTPHETYTVVVLAVNGLSGAVARSQVLTVIPEGAPLTLAVVGTPTLTLELGQTVTHALLLSTTLADYPELAIVVADTVPSGLGLALPLAPLTPTLTGVSVPVVITASEYVTYGTHLVPLTAYGAGDNAAAVLILHITGPTLNLDLAGDGFVDVQPSGQVCEEDCLSMYPSGTVVTLRARKSP